MMVLEATLDKMHLIIKNIYIEELEAEFNNDEMECDAIRKRVMSRLQSIISPELFARTYTGIWDCIGNIQSELMLSERYGDEFIKCVNDSGIPFRHPCTLNTLKDPKSVIVLAENIPNLTEMVIDVLEDYIYAVDTEIIVNKILYLIDGVVDLNLDRIYDNIRCLRYADDSDSLVSKLKTKIVNMDEYLDDVEPVPDSNQMQLFNLEVPLADEIECELSNHLEAIMNNELKKLVLNPPKVREMTVQDSNFRTFTGELDIMYDLDYLVTTNSEANELISSKAMMYNLSHDMYQVVQKEFLIILLEGLRKKCKHKSVKYVIAALMMYYLQFKCI